MDSKAVGFGDVGLAYSDSGLDEHLNYILPALKRLIPEGGRLRIIDVGCGNGFLTNELCRMGHDAVGIDISEDGIRLAKKEHPDARFMVRSAYDDLKGIMPDPDVVLACEAIEHMVNPKAFLQNAYFALKPGGVVILTTPYHGYMKNLALSLIGRWDHHFESGKAGGHIKFFSEKTLSSMLVECGFKDIVYHNAGRIPRLWKSIACRAKKG